MTRVDQLRAALTAAFAPRHLVIVDEGHLHAGHAGAATGRGHFRVEIVADAFAGLPPLARHRQVYAALGDLLQTEVHALSIQARTPDEA